MKEANKIQTRIFLVSAKISIRSMKRYQKVPKIASYLFGFFDHIFVQNSEYFNRFKAIGLSEQLLTVTGNLKLDDKPLIDIKQKQYLQGFIKRYYVLR